MIHILSIRKGKALYFLLAAILYNIFSCADNIVHAGQKEVEEQLKAVFLYSLSHFVTWPETVDNLYHSFDIGVISSNTFKKTLQQAVERETRHNKPFKIRELGTTKTVHPEDYKIVFIGSAQIPQWLKIREIFRQQPTLTVSDNRDFTKNGGMVTLLYKKERITIEINYKNIQESGLVISAKLLRLAKIVGQ